MSEFAVGDKVRVALDRYPGVWTVQKLNPTTTVVVPEGGGRGLKVPHSLLRDPDAEAPPTRYFHPGEVVRLSGRFAGMYAVIRDDGGDKVNVALLGGDGGRYVRSLRALVEPIDVPAVFQ